MGVAGEPLALFSAGARDLALVSSASMSRPAIIFLSKFFPAKRRKVSDALRLAFSTPLLSYPDVTESKGWYRAAFEPASTSYSLLTLNW